MQDDLPVHIVQWAGAQAFSLPDLGWLVVPVFLTTVLLVHCLYFLKGRRIDGQQLVEIDDLTRLVDSGSDRFTVIRADGTEFDIQSRGAREVAMPLSNLSSAFGRPAQGNDERPSGGYRPLICHDDLKVEADRVFDMPVKIGGDLLIRGRALFLAPVVVDGVISIEGSAHFAAGLVGKGDALIRGSVAIGSDDGESWAVIRELALREQLSLNGTIVAERAVQLRKAA